MTERIICENVEDTYQQLNNGEQYQLGGEWSGDFNSWVLEKNLTELPTHSKLLIDLDVMHMNWWDADLFVFVFVDGREQQVDKEGERVIDYEPRHADNTVCQRNASDDLIVSKIIVHRVSLSFPHFATNATLRVQKNENEGPGSLWAVRDLTIRVSTRVKSSPTDCAQCPAGYECKETEKFACPPGSYSKAGDGECSACPAGQYMKQTNATMCMLCPPGHFCPEGLGRVGTIEPLVLPAGWYSDAIGLAEAQAEGAHQCPEGQFLGHFGS